VNASDPVHYNPKQYTQTVRSKSYSNGVLIESGQYNHVNTAKADNGGQIITLNMSSSAEPSLIYKKDESKVSKAILVPGKENHSQAIRILPHQHAMTTVNNTGLQMEITIIYSVQPWGDYIPTHLHDDQKWTRGTDYSMISYTHDGQQYSASDFPAPSTSISIKEQVKVASIIQDPLGQTGGLAILHIFRENEQGIFVLKSIEHHVLDSGIRREIEHLRNGEFEITEHVVQSDNGESSFTHPNELIELFDTSQFN